MTHASMIRPAWTPITITLMVLGFVIFWPFGLAVLAYILWGDRWHGVQNGIDRMTDKIARKNKGCGRRHYRAQRTDNVAFEDWREEELERMKEERRKLDETIAEFETYKEEKRRAKDTEEFDDFMTERKRKPAPRSKRSGPAKPEGK